MRLAEVADDRLHSENIVGCSLCLLESALRICRVLDAMGQPLSGGPPEYDGVTQMPVRARVVGLYRVIRLCRDFGEV